MQSRPDEFSILNPGSREFVPLESVPFYQDLNLDQVIDKMAVRWGKDMKKYYRYLPSSSDEVAYRRNIYGDIRKEEVYKALVKFTEDLDVVAKLRLEKEKALQLATLRIKEKYGKNAILKGTNFLEGAMTRERNQWIGGHKA